MKSHYISMICDNFRDNELNYGALFANMTYAREEYEQRVNAFINNFLMPTDMVEETELRCIVKDTDGRIVFQIEMREE